MNIKVFINQQITKLQSILDKSEIALGEIIFNNSDCQVLSQSAVRFELIVNSELGDEQAEFSLNVFDEDLIPSRNGEQIGWDRNSYACLLQVKNELQFLDPKETVEHKKYTREGMIKRVMQERRIKADKARYRIKWASNIYGDHILTNKKWQRVSSF